MARPRTKPFTLTLERLREVYSYDPITGEFSRKDARGPGFSPNIRNKNAYSILMVDGERIYAHRLAWWMVYGELPGADEVIDHVNNIKGDNRICNLRRLSHVSNVNRDRYACVLAHANWSHPQLYKYPVLVFGDDLCYASLSGATMRRTMTWQATTTSEWTSTGLCRIS